MQKLYIFIIIIYLFEEQYEFLHLNARGTKSNKAVGNMYSRFLLKMANSKISYRDKLLLYISQFHLVNITIQCTKFKKTGDDFQDNVMFQ